MQFLQLMVAFAIICGTHAAEVFLNRRNTGYSLCMHCLSQLYCPLESASIFFKCQLTGVRNATSYPGTDVCITVILSWQSSLQHKYHGV